MHSSPRPAVVSQVELWPGYAVRILDGHALAATEHRLQVLRDEAVDIFPCEDGHAQERRLLNQVLATVQPQQLWIADRNMCRQGFLLGMAKRDAAFVIREH